MQPKEKVRDPHRSGVKTVVIIIFGAMKVIIILGLGVWLGLVSNPSWAGTGLQSDSELIQAPGSPYTYPFCSHWDPSFSEKGAQCCGARQCSRRKKRRSYCNEVDSSNSLYLGEGDRLQLLEKKMSQRPSVSACDSENGFLAWGSPVLETPGNRIQIKNPKKCTNYGTDQMAAMLEWLGRQLAERYPIVDYPGAKLLVGNISAPRGGCLGHRSHMSGRDLDLGFFSPKKKNKAKFSRHFDVAANWWLINKLFQNPYACVESIFLDQSHIQKLARFGENQQKWEDFRDFFKHVPRHLNHFHIRIEDKTRLGSCLKKNT